MATVGPEHGSDNGHPERRLPLRWALIMLVAGLAAIACYPIDGNVAAMATATAVAVALHAMID